MSILNELSEKFERYLSLEIVNADADDLNMDITALLVSSNEDLLVKKNYSMASAKAKAVQDRTWEFLNIGRWCDVPFSIRRIYATACLIKVCSILRLGAGDVMSVLNEALSTTDNGLLLGSSHRTQLTNMASTLSAAIHAEWLKTNENSNLSGTIIDYEDKPTDWDVSGIKGEPVSTLKCPSLETFSLAFFNTQTPVKLTDCINHWPALTKWKDADYLLKVGGGRKVPIEVGSQYTQNDWSMKLCTLREFITSHIINRQPVVGYLAQHQLFSQVPELNDDIRIPEYCCLSQSDEDPDVDINAWFGPNGTVSPLHHDPKHNFLTQVLGRKRVLLFSPECSSSLYAYEGKMLSNTSEVDPENPNYERFPKFIKANAYECHLYPGEMLYIPPKWWHHVRSLDISFSVSFWWM